MQAAAEAEPGDATVGAPTSCVAPGSRTAVGVERHQKVVAKEGEVALDRGGVTCDQPRVQATASCSAQSSSSSSLRSSAPDVELVSTAA
jgi:hypothetical protein